MWPSVPLFLFKIASSFFLGFAFWRRLKSDYPPTPLLVIYLLTCFSLFLFPLAIGLLLQKLSSPSPLPIEIYFWIGGCLGFFLSSRLYRKEKINFWEIADFLWLILSGLAIINLIFSLSLKLIAFQKLPLSQVVCLGWWLLIWGFSFWLSFSFRQLTWYKSGRVGLSATLGVAVYFFGNALLAFFLPSQLYWGGSTILKPTFIFLPISLGLFVLVHRHANIELDIIKLWLDIKSKISQIKTHGQH